MEDVGLDTSVEKEGGNDDRVEDRLVDVGNTTPNYDSKFTLEVHRTFFLVLRYYN